VGFYLRMNIFVMNIKEINPPTNKACAECFNEEITKKKRKERKKEIKLKTFSTM
jgi:hypothetical protein